MILQALTSYYERLAEQGLVARPGWGPAKVSYAIDLNADGTVFQVYSLLREPENGKSGKMIPSILSLPLGATGRAAIKPIFLWDNSGYLLGSDKKGKPKRTAECFAASKALHQALLGSCESEAARAICLFFDRWTPDQGPTSPETAPYWEELTSGCNLLFYYDGTPVSEDPEVRKAWQLHYDHSEDGTVMRCLVTGEEAVIPPIHSAIKGIQGAQSSGAALVSFNAKAFESYDREQNYNAPVGEYAAFAYTTALNYLIADWSNRVMIGDTRVLCWAESGESAYQALSFAAMMGGGSDSAENDVRSAVSQLSKGRRIEWDETSLDPDMRFYVLGLAPNAARLSVRFFLQNSFGAFMRNIDAHYERLRIVKPSFEKFDTIPVKWLLEETVNPKSQNRAASPQLAGDLLRSILTGAPYPATLLNAVELRIRAESEVNYRKAAIIKAYYSRNKTDKCPEEVLQVALNESSINIPYNLGRLFSVLELIQENANPGINTTIRDKYFNSAAATPARIFAILNNLSEKHLRKLEPRQRVWLEKQRLAITDRLPERLPDRLSLPEQGAFQLGYYHQTQKRYEKKGE
jgi:CRISPR-associated protein Csd1